MANALLLLTRPRFKDEKKICRNACTVGLISPVQHVYPCSETRHCKHR